MAQVTALPVGVTTVTVEFIGTLQGGSGVSDYNALSNIPVINQDLSASGFTPTANTYYRHTGATTDTFTQGVIYLYDTEYHKLGESGGGTTLNRYELSITTDSLYLNAPLLLNIYLNAKGQVLAGKYDSSPTSGYFRMYTPAYIDRQYVRFMSFNPSKSSVQITGCYCSEAYRKQVYFEVDSNKTIINGGSNDWNETIKIIYYNDTEITA